MSFNYLDYVDTTPNINTSLDLTKLNLRGDLTTNSDIVLDYGDVEVNTGKLYIKHNATLNSVLTCVNATTGECDFLALPSAFTGINQATQSALDTKQNLITSSSKLSGSNVSFNSSDVSTTLTNNNTRLTTLETDNTTNKTNITTLTTGLNTKQSTLSASNKLNSDYVDVVGTNLTSTLDTLNTNINAKLNKSGGTISGLLKISTGATIGKLLYCSDVNGSCIWKNDALTLATTNLTGTTNIASIERSVSNQIITSNTTTLDFASAELFFCTPANTTANTLTISNVPTSVYSSYTVKAYINTSTNKAFFSTVVIGTATTPVSWASNITPTPSTFLNLTVQEFQIIYTTSTTSPYKIICSYQTFN